MHNPPIIFSSIVYKLFEFFEMLSWETIKNHVFIHIIDVKYAFEKTSQPTIE